MRDVCRPFLKDMIDFKCDQNDFVCMLCGSSLIEDNPRDTDIFIYTKSDPEMFAKAILSHFKTIDGNAFYYYCEFLSFYSVKYKSSAINYSIHIVAIQQLNECINRIADTNIFTDVNIYEVKLNMQTVYRKWILETEYLFGNEKLRESIINNLEMSKKKIPYTLVIDILKKRIINNIKYFFEKAQKLNVGIFGEIVVCQIINNLICLCYLVNAKFYGTVKYIEQDLQGFESNIVFSQSCLKLLKCLNISDFEFYNKTFTSILKGLDEL